MHLLKLSEWEENGRYHVNDTSELCGNAAKWWAPMRCLNLNPEEYVMMLKDKFHASEFRYKKEYDVLIFSFSKLQDARNFKNFVNKKARERNFII